jgi:hypothetical protein
MSLLSESDARAGSDRLPPTLRAAGGHLTNLKHGWEGRYRANGAAPAFLMVVADFAAPRALNSTSITLVSPLAGMLAIVSLGHMLLGVLAGIACSLAATTVIHYVARTRTHPP